MKSMQRRIALFTAGIVAAISWSSPNAYSATYNVNLSYSPVPWFTGYGVTGMEGANISPFYSFSPGDTVDLGNILLGARITADSSGNLAVISGFVRSAVVPGGDPFNGIFGGFSPSGSIIYQCNTRVFPAGVCEATVVNALAASVPSSVHLIFTIPEGGSGVQLVFSNPVTYEAPTPIPAAFPLFATGLGLLGYLGYRRRHTARKTAERILLSTQVPLTAAEN